MRIVVTGASRGIGAELVRQLTQRGDDVIAGVRRILPTMTASRVTFRTCDVSSETSVHSFASEVMSSPVDILINNAGVMNLSDRLGALDFEDLKHTFDVNVLGPLRVTQALLPALEKGRAKKIVSIGSALGSLTQNDGSVKIDAYSYPVSKSALNMVTRCLARDLTPKGFIVASVHPGWVQTDMGGAEAPVPVAESVAGILEVMDGMRAGDSGRFLSYLGEELPW